MAGSYSKNDLYAPQKKVQATPNAYQGNLTTNFEAARPKYTAPRYDASTGQWTNPRYDYTGGAGSKSTDSDVRGAQAAWNELQNPDQGTSTAEKQALYNMYQGRINLKNSLAEQIAGSENQLKQTEGLLRTQANEALGEGLTRTRENYNSRGLLYSGQREGAEVKQKGAVASQLASGLSGARRDSSNALEAAKSAYINVGLQQQQEKLKLAQQAFDTATKNSIARSQAMQQLYGGFGKMAGSIYGSYGGESSGNSMSRPASYNYTQDGVGGRQGLMANIGEY